MRAEEAKRIWESEIEKNANKFISHIEKKILSNTYQQNVSLYLFNYHDVFSDSEEDIKDDFTLEVFNRTVKHFENLGFHVKSDPQTYQIWIAYLKDNLVRNNVFAENLTTLLEMKKYYRFNIKRNILSEIDILIREKAKRSRSLEYDLTINTPNENSLLLDDLKDILDELKKADFTVSILNITRDQKPVDSINLPDIIQKGDNLIFEEKKVRLVINW